MVRSNQAAFGYAPAKVWPANPEIITTSNFTPVINGFNALNKTDPLNESITATFNIGQGDKYVASLWAKTKPGIEALEELKSTILPAVSAQISQGAVAGNNAYQAFRKVNADNRIEINNSTSGLIPFRANYVNESKMSDSTQEMKSAADAMGRAAQGVASAADGRPCRSTASGCLRRTPPVPPRGAPQPAPTPAPVPPAPPTPVIKPDPLKDALGPCGAWACPAVWGCPCLRC
ncbi:hypothetical protein [Mycobacteroides chelonae]|uniref:hypothetical protein n=1 Tax=Mycobacteroides chelonae TaxID=1774 RepID=UPI003AAAA8A7